MFPWQESPIFTNNYVNLSVGNGNYSFHVRRLEEGAAKKYIKIKQFMCNQIKIMDLKKPAYQIELKCTHHVIIFTYFVNYNLSCL